MRPCTLSNRAENLIDSEVAIHERNLRVHDFMVKCKVKPVLDQTTCNSIAATQAIAYQDKTINARVSNEEFAQQLTSDIGVDVFRNYPKLEVDMSKFDKSQGRVVLLFEMEMMRLFGVPEYYRDLWWEMHAQTTLKSRAHKMSTEITFQRKSGDASTFFGNTMFLMSVLGMV